MPAILGNRAHLQRINRYFVSSYQWMNGEPCMFVWPRHREKGGAFALPLESAHLWAQSDGHPNLAHAIPTAVNALEMMGLSGTKDEIRALIDTILDGIPDLISMPPEPSSDKPQPAGSELAIKCDGETVYETEVAA